MAPKRATSSPARTRAKSPATTKSPATARAKSPVTTRAKSPATRAKSPAKSTKASPAKNSASISASAWLLLATTYFAYVCIYCARKPFAVAKSSIQSDLNVSNQALGNIDTALLTTYAIGQLSLGYAVHAVGRKWTLVLAFLLAGAFTAAFGLVDSPLAMGVLWGMAGLTAAPASPLFSTLVGEAVPDAVRGTVIGVWSSCENLGGVLANLIAAGVLSRQGWRAVFFVSGPVVAVWALALLLVVPRDAPPATKPATKSAKPKAAAASGVTPLSVPGVGAAAFAYTLTKCARYCLMFWLPYLLKSYIKMEESTAGYVSAVLDFCGTFGAILTGVACDTLYGGAALHTAMHLCAATGVCFILWAVACAVGASTAVHVMAIGSIGFFIAGPGGVLGASARGLVGYAGLAADAALISSVAGLVNGLASTGAVAQSLLAPQLVALLGWPGLFAVLGCAMLCAAVALRPAVAIEADALKKKSKTA